MKHLLFISTLCSCGLAVAAERSQPLAPVDELTQAAVQSAFQILRSEYIRRDDLTFDELNRAALQGLLSRLDFGAELIRHDGKEAPPMSGLHSELLTPDVAYVRPQAFVEGEVTQMETSLRQFATQGVPWLILDLRSPAAPGSFDVAASMLDFFLPQGGLIFKMKQIGKDSADLTLSKTDAIWKQPVVVLIDGETGNIGETIAAVLQQRERALLIGAPTRGGTVRYETVSVDEHWSLRFARAEMLLQDDTSLFKKGLKPEYPVDLPTNVKQAVFKDSLGASIKPHVFDQARLRYNEAALVAGKHPELDAYIRRSAGQSVNDDVMPERDTVLQRAVDMIQSSGFIGGNKIQWNTKFPRRNSGAGASSTPPGTKTTSRQG